MSEKKTKPLPFTRPERHSLKSKTADLRPAACELYELAAAVSQSSEIGQRTTLWSRSGKKLVQEKLPTNCSTSMSVQPVKLLATSVKFHTIQRGTPGGYFECLQLQEPLWEAVVCSR